jgi:hypothetical protein
MPSYAKLTRDLPLDDCVLGTLIANGQVFYTLERPWLNNKPDVSCIPTGFYKCRYQAKSNNGKLSNVYAIKDVPDREGVLIHIGNFVHESKGCILLGLGREPENQKVINSGIAMAKFIEIMGDAFELLIEERVA